MRQLLLSALLLCGLSGCACFPSAPTGDPDLPPVDITVLEDYATHGRVLVRFTLNDGAFTHVVQEVYLDDGKVLVESFRWDGGIKDSHRWSNRPHTRTMIVYAANVTGTDEMWGFAHLPDNGAGVKTTVGKGFNSFYWTGHKMQGRIVSRSPGEFRWTIYDDGTDVTVTLPQGGQDD